MLLWEYIMIAVIQVSDVKYSARAMIYLVYSRLC